MYEVAGELGWPRVHGRDGELLLPPTELSWWVACQRRTEAELRELVDALKAYRAGNERAKAQVPAGAEG